MKLYFQQLWPILTTSAIVTYMIGQSILFFHTNWEYWQDFFDQKYNFYFGNESLDLGPDPTYTGPPGINLFPKSMPVELEQPQQVLTRTLEPLNVTATNFAFDNLADASTEPTATATDPNNFAASMNPVTQSNTYYDEIRTGQNEARIWFIISFFFWAVNISQFFLASKILGPYIMMIGKMLVDMMLFIIILTLSLFIFGIVRQATLNPNNENIRLKIDAIYERLLEQFDEKNVFPYYTILELNKRGIEVECRNESKVYEIEYFKYKYVDVEQIQNQHHDMLKACSANFAINFGDKVAKLNAEKVMPAADRREDLEAMTNQTTSNFYASATPIRDQASFSLQDSPETFAQTGKPVGSSYFGGGRYSPEAFIFSKPLLMIIEEVFHEPYFMLYGEVYAPTIDPCFGKESMLHQCNVGSKLIPYMMAIFLLMSNVLMLNLLIAVFNSTYQEVKKTAITVWKYDQYGRVTELEDAPYCPPPLVIFEQCWYLYKKLTKKNKFGKIDKGLKLFLDSKEVEIVQDFEEDRMADLLRTEMNERLREKIDKQKQSTTAENKQDIDKINNSMHHFMGSMNMYMAEMAVEREQMHIEMMHEQNKMMNSFFDKMMALQQQQNLNLKSPTKQVYSPMHESSCFTKSPPKRPYHNSALYSVDVVGGSSYKSSLKNCPSQYDQIEVQDAKLHQRISTQMPKMSIFTNSVDSNHHSLERKPRNQRRRSSVTAIAPNLNPPQPSLTLEEIEKDEKKHQIDHWINRASEYTLDEKNQKTWSKESHSYDTCYKKNLTKSSHNERNKSDDLDGNYVFSLQKFSSCPDLSQIRYASHDSEDLDTKHPNMNNRKQSTDGDAVFAQGNVNRFVSRNQAKPRRPLLSKNRSINATLVKDPTSDRNKNLEIPGQNIIINNVRNYSRSRHHFNSVSSNHPESMASNIYSSLNFPGNQSSYPTQRNLLNLNQLKLPNSMHQFPNLHPTLNQLTPRNRNRQRFHSECQPEHYQPMAANLSHHTILQKSHPHNYLMSNAAHPVLESIGNNTLYEENFNRNNTTRNTNNNNNKNNSNNKQNINNHSYKNISRYQNR